tara:strand:- start:43 stop:438 length:396 start_codon:yes stop_codon:yes gene_type:complete
MSTLNVDALVGNTSANAITVRGEGSATTSLQQGLAKSWVNFDGTGTPASRDSLNNSSITDSSTGNFTSNFTTNMANDDYSAMVGTGSTGATNRNSSVDGMATSSISLQTYNVSNSNVDHEFNFCNAHGDLS